MQHEPISPADEARNNGRGVLKVFVPAEATVVVNGLTTTSQGQNRRYVSYGLKPGQDYRYQVSATVVKDGKPVTQSKSAVLRNGQIADVRFDFDQSSRTMTSLTLRVPANAKVFLSGTETKSTGEVRRFSTDKISKGQKWDDYIVSVTSEIDGKAITKEKRVSITGGDQREVVFDFDQPELAAAR